MRTSKITTALAVAALVVAVLGTTPLGHAAGSILPRNSVGTVQVKKAAITSGKLHTGSVTGAKVLDGSLTAADFKAASLPAGPKGDKGDTGATGPSDVYLKDVSSHSIGTSNTDIGTLTMPIGDYLVTAKLYVQTAAANIPGTIVDCTLRVGHGGGAVYDHAKATISSGPSGPVLVTSMMLANTYTGADYATLSCTSPNAATAEWVKITATKAGALHGS